LRTVYGKSLDESKHISAVHRAVKERVQQKRKPITCPDQGMLEVGGEGGKKEVPQSQQGRYRIYKVS
jgi:hypothetical protein